MSIEATRHQNPIWSEVIDHRGRDLLKGALHDVSCGTPWQRDVDGEPHSVGTSNFLASSRTREQRPLMGRDIENAGVIPEDGLGAIPVMDVPVDDQHPLTLRRKRCRTHGNVVEQAESHCAVRFCVMTRR
ncbi:MAG: hypothetical protein WAL61_02120, partial [Acidimicrobiales bacterium]